MSQSPRNIVWIASYPKSGNTWVRFMLCNLLFGRQDSAAALAVLAPDLHECGPQLVAGTHAGLVKTHFCYSTALPLAERSAAAIYVYRNPADVLASNFHYAQRSSAVAGDGRLSLDDYVEQFLSSRGDPRWRALGMGSWEDNVKSWLSQPLGFPVIPVRYEDLVADPTRVCRRLAQLVRPSSTDAEIEAAVANASFARMREVEDSDIRRQQVGIFYKPYLQKSIESGRRFMRSGQVGDGERLLSPAQRERLNEAFGQLLAQVT